MELALSPSESDKLSFSDFKMFEVSLEQELKRRSGNGTNGNNKIVR